MIYFSDREIDHYIAEDLPYEDLTTSFLRIENKPAKIQFSTRTDSVVCCTEEVLKIFSKLAIQTTLFTPSGEFIEKSVKFLEAEGLAKNLHAAWRVAENLMGYASGIATRTRALVNIAENVNPQISICATRKTFPGTKKIAVKAVLAGKGHMHRLGLSESVLVFDNHRNLFGDFNQMITRIQERRSLACDKNITVEIKDPSEIETLIKAGIKSIQLDKFLPQQIKEVSVKAKKLQPGIRIIAAGGITDENIEQYALSGANILVTSWPYLGPPADFNVKITML
ncbi:MAG: ModD protein [Bacteroidales bacterium]|nr:ModD protein [Bacteroidales bacterium]